MPESMSHALSMYKDNAWPQRSCPFLIQRPCLTLKVMPFLCTKTMPDSKSHALSLHITLNLMFSIKSIRIVKMINEEERESKKCNVELLLNVIPQVTPLHPDHWQSQQMCITLGDLGDTHLLTLPVVRVERGYLWNYIQ